MSKISVIIPCYNHKLFIGRCLRSILDQTLNKKFYNVIVIDDASTDGSLKIIEQFSTKIKIIKNKKNMGLSYSVNLGIKNSKSDYIVRLDSDDYVNKNFLYFLLEFIEGNKDHIDAISCDYLLVDDQEKIIRRENCEKNPIACGIMFKTSDVIELGLYNEKLKINEEIELRERYEKRFKIGRLNLPLYRYRRHLTNITNKIRKNEFF